MDKLEIRRRIDTLRQERQAVILAHYYAPEEVQEAADFVGDSLELSRKAAASQARTIVFCGVDFMAESAKILAYDKTVLTPDPRAACPMANMLSLKQLKKYKAANPDVLVVAYVNCSAEIKAESYICCTSANAEKVVRSLPEGRRILFVPDQHLGGYVAKIAGREMELWPGFCPIHQRYGLAAVAQAKADHPKALLLVHPESPKETAAKADFVGSTSAIIRYCQDSSCQEFIIATEEGVMKALRDAMPQKKFYPLVPGNVCYGMKLLTLEKLLWCLEDMEYEITLDKETAKKAKTALERMLSL